MTTPAWNGVAEELTCAEAAELLGIPPEALEQWAQRLSYPQDVGGAGTGTRFKRVEVEALRDALACAHSVEGAVRAARARANT